MEISHRYYQSKGGGGQRDGWPCVARGPSTHLHDAKALPHVGDHRQYGTRSHSKLPVQERVVRPLKVRFERLRPTDHVNDVRRARNVQDFHHRVIHRVECGEQIEIPRHKHHQVQLLRLDGNTNGILGDPQAEQ